VRRILSVFKALVISSMRSPVVIFWNIFFPVILLLILASIFSNVGKDVSVKVAFVNESTTFKNTNMDFANYISDAFKSMSVATDGKTPILTLEASTTRNFLNNSLERLKFGKINAVVVIPPLFNTQVYASLAQQSSNFKLFSKPKVQIYTLENSQTSNVAFTILSSVIESFNSEFLKKSGNYGDFVSPVMKYVSKNGQNFSYTNFLVPGIIVMALMTVSLFGITDDLLVQREKKVLRKLFVAPLSKVEYFWSMILSNITIEILQVAIIVAIGFWLGATLNFNIWSIFYLIFAIVTTLPLGFFVASFAKTADSGNAMANIFNFLFMFLGGLFFPLTGVPFAIKIIAYAIPTTYLGNGLRSAMGVMASPTPSYLNVIVPLAWAIVMVIYSAKAFKWEA